MAHHVSLSVITRSEKDWLPAFNLLSDLAMTHGNEFAQISVSSVDFDDIAEEPEGVEEYHDEKTLGKVYDAVRLALDKFGLTTVSEGLSEDVVNSLQNAGILFREIKK